MDEALKMCNSNMEMARVIGGWIILGAACFGAALFIIYYVFIGMRDD